MSLAAFQISIENQSSHLAESDQLLIEFERAVMGPLPPLSLCTYTLHSKTLSSSWIRSPLATM